MSQSMAGMTGPKGGEYAGRVRAAIAYSGLRPTALAKQHDGLATRTLYNYMRNGGPLTPNGEAYRLQIAKACGVPERFMLKGFGGATERQPPEDLNARLDRLEREAAELRDLLGPEGQRQTGA